jgi:hypothetical protein
LGEKVHSRKEAEGNRKTAIIERGLILSSSIEHFPSEFKMAYTGGMIKVRNTRRAHFAQV